MRLLAAFLAIAVISGSATAQSETPDSRDIFDIVQGDWRISLEDGSVVQTCDQLQHFEVSPDRNRIVLSEPWADFTATYRVIYAEQYRVLTIIEGEDKPPSKAIHTCGGSTPSITTALPSEGTIGQRTR